MSAVKSKSKKRKPRVPATQRFHKPTWYHELSGKSYDYIAARIKDGSIKAFDLSVEGATRPDWWIHEDDWQAFLDSRANVQAKLVVPEPVRQPVKPRQYV